jgi:hypothetical protein
VSALAIERVGSLPILGALRVRDFRPRRHHMGAGILVLGAAGLAVALGASRLFDGPPRQAAGSAGPSAAMPDA